MRLSGKVAIITGGNRGIGKAISLAFAREGAKVVVVGRNKSRCNEVVDQVIKEGGEAISIQVDVASEADVARMAKQTKDKYQRIDILVNNAAVNLPYRTVSELTLEEWNWILNVNLTGPFLCIRSVLPEMITQRSGKIINLSSIGGRHGAAGRTPYRATKAAIINLTECIAAEVKEFGIDVNAICPGAVDTDMLREITGGEIPTHTMPPEDIAAVAVFLASDESKAVTGTAIDAFGKTNPIFGVPPSVRPIK
ncbi:MAG: SDR family oxidoreductase [Chloroflexota bacterium]|nr:SDR family oxidoreductase [Chloroflexota bacterium]